MCVSSKYNRNNFKAVTLTIIMGLLTFTATSCQEKTKTVKNVDLNKYQGVWFEIARLPFRPEKDLVNITAEYTLEKNNRIKVVNKGFFKNPEGKLKKATGVAYLPDANEPGKLRVRFFGIFGSDYLIVSLDTANYQYAMVTNRNNTLLWILSRTPQMNNERYNLLVNEASDLGIDTSLLIKTIQQW